MINLRQTFLSPLTLCKRLKEEKAELGIPPPLLLGDPSIQIKEIAINSGYPSVSYFNKIFMVMEGMTYLGLTNIGHPKANS